MNILLEGNQKFWKKSGQVINEVQQEYEKLHKEFTEFAASISYYEMLFDRVQYGHTCSVLYFFMDFHILPMLKYITYEGMKVRDAKEGSQERKMKCDQLNHLQFQLEQDLKLLGDFMDSKWCRVNNNLEEFQSELKCTHLRANLQRQLIDLEMEEYEKVEDTHHDDVVKNLQSLHQLA